MSSLSFLSALLLPSHPVLLPPLNISLATNVALNATVLGGWPPEVGWRIPLSPDLTVVIQHYGEYATRSMYNQIQQGLNDIRQRLEAERPVPVNSRWPWGIYTSSGVMLNFDAEGHSSIPLFQILDVLKAIDGFYFLYGYGPRELGAEVRVSSLPTFDMEIAWTSKTDGWPAARALPFRLTDPRNPFAIPQFEVYMFARDLDGSSQGQVTSPVLQSK